MKDAAAELKMIRTGTLDLFEAISRNGYDPEERPQKIARINEVLDKLEIILDRDPRNVTDRGQGSALWSWQSSSPRARSRCAVSRIVVIVWSSRGVRTRISPAPDAG